MWLIKWTGYSKDQIVTISKDKIMTITNATDSMTQSYHNIVKDYDKENLKQLDNTKYQKQQFSDDTNKELNEIFDEYEDEEFDGTYKKTLH